MKHNITYKGKYSFIFLYYSININFTVHVTKKWKSVNSTKNYNYLNLFILELRHIYYVLCNHTNLISKIN